MQLKLKLQFDKSTKGTHRFAEVDDRGLTPAEPVIGTLYIRKAHMPTAPDAITVTVNWP
jgi:hypothetical protein